MDWEYPVVPGPPDHPFSLADKDNFTALIKELKSVMQPDDILSFAAEDFFFYLEQSIDWKAVMPMIDHVNIITYDLYNGSNKQTGHTPPSTLTKIKTALVDHAVNYLINQGVSSNQIIIGAAFYGKIWNEVLDVNNGLYQTGVFFKSLGYKDWKQLDPGYAYYRDNISKAPYAYNKEKGYF